MISDASVWLILFMPFMDFSFILWPKKLQNPHGEHHLKGILVGE